MTARIALAAAKSRRPISAHRRRLGVAAIVMAPAITFFSHCALADEDGVSFWIPGLFGSLAATPQQPGWSLANIYYHTSVSAGADVARAREFTLGRVPANVTVRMTPAQIAEAQKLARGNSVIRCAVMRDAGALDVEMT